MGSKKPSLLVGLELGPREFTAAAGEVLPDHRLIVREVESIPAEGFEKEGLSDPIECADVVARLVRRIEKNLPARITRATAAFPTSHLRVLNASATIPIPDPAGGISRQDVERALATCRTLSLDYDRQIVHAFERGFSVDGQSGVRNPVGLSGKKLSVEIHLVTAPTLAVQNFTRVLNRAGLEVEGFVMPGLGAAAAVLPDLDRDLGVTLVRIGEFQTEVLLFEDGDIRETFLMPGGVEDLLETLSRSLKLPRVSAEYLFEQVRSVEEQPATAPVAAGVLGPAADGRPDWASVPLRTGPGAAVRTFPQGQVVQVVRSRAKDHLSRIQRRLAASPLFLDCASGVVVVGYLSRLEGFLEMAEGMLNMPVRLGAVKGMELASGLAPRPQDLTAIGLLRHSARRRSAAAQPSNAPPWLRPLERVQRILQEYF